MSIKPLRFCCLQWACLVISLAAVTSLSADEATPAKPAPAGPWAWTGDAAGLHCLSLCELEDLYSRGTVTAPPVGWLPGEVIAFTNLPVPKLLKKMADSRWVGKHIEADGSFINQWKNRQALASCLTIGPSYADCRPALVFEYPRWTPLFGPMRDEYREIAPGLFLGRMYRRVPYVKFLGFNYLKLSEGGCCTSDAPAHEPAPAGANPTPGVGAAQPLPEGSR